MQNAHFGFSPNQSIEDISVKCHDKSKLKKHLFKIVRSTHIFFLSNISKNKSQNFCRSCIYLFIFYKGHIIDQSLKVSIRNIEICIKQTILLLDIKL